MMAFQNDIVAYDALGQLVLVVEVRVRLGTDSKWAAGTRQILLENALVWNARYFLLALPDRFYLWVDKQQTELVNPDYVINPLSFLKPYLGEEGASEYLSVINFGMVVEAWLATLTWTETLSSGTAASESWLLESGLFDVLKHGHLTSEVPL